VILGWLASNWYQTRLLDDQRAQVLRELTPYGSTLTLNIYQRLALLEGLKAFAETHPPENHNIQEFETFARGLYLSATGIRNLSIIPKTGQKYMFPKLAAGTVRGQTLLRPPPNTAAATELTRNSRQISLNDPYRLQQGSLGLGGSAGSV
jgi:sensor domain CHASE-containing protein